MSDSKPFSGSKTRSWEGVDAGQIVNAGLLNPDLDLDALATEFAEQGRLQIEDALRPEVADILFNCLHQEVPWCLTFRDRAGPRKMWPQELAALSPHDREDLEQQIREVAQAAFQFRYDSFMMVSAYKEQRHPELVLHRVIEQINRQGWLEPMRHITGFQHIRRADAQATRYVAGHFLRPHDDVHEEEGRLAAYVINLTRDWCADWGGLLQFLGPEGEVTDTFMPRYNTISMFRVPADHCVSPVASFAPGARYAITGWLRT
jgi:SM-20-related protein